MKKLVCVISLAVCSSYSSAAFAQQRDTFDGMPLFRFQAGLSREEIDAIPIEERVQYLGHFYGRAVRVIVYKQPVFPRLREHRMRRIK